MMNDSPISDSVLGIVREECNSAHPDIHLPLHIVKGMIARIDQEEATPETFADAINAAGRHMIYVLETIELAKVYAQDECPDTLPMFRAVFDGFRELSQAFIEMRSSR